MGVRFDIGNPYGSIAKFCDGLIFLDEEQKKSFTQEAREFFVENAFFDQTVPIPEGLAERFAATDLGLFLGATGFVRTEELRLLATIEKVTQRHFATLSYSVTQEMKDDHWSWTGDRVIIDCDWLPIHKALNSWFDPEKLQESLSRLAGRIELFHPAERVSISRTIRSFFINCALEKKTVKISIPLAEKVVGTLWNRTLLERQGFVAAIQIALQKNFDPTILPLIDDSTGVYGWLSTTRHTDPAARKVKGLNAQVALTLQLLQAARDLSPLEPIGKVRCVTELLNFAKQNDLRGIAGLAADWLKENQ